MTQPAAAPRIRLLCVDDQGDDRELIKHQLERQHGGFLVTPAASGPEFEARLEEDAFDAVLVAFRAADVDVMQILHQVRAKRPLLPVVVLTRSGSQELAVAVLGAGAADYLVESAGHLARLPAALLSAVERGRLRQEREQTIEEANHFFDQAPEPLLIADLTFRARRANPAFTRATGYTAEDLRSQPWFERVHPEERAQTVAAAEALQRDGEVAIECRYLCRDGAYRCFKWHARADRLHGVVYVALHDISQSREQEAAQSRLAAILEATTDLVGTASADRSVLSLNRAGRAMLGLTYEEKLEGLKITEIHPPWAASIVQNIGIPSALAHGAWSGETAFQHRDGPEIPVSQVIIAHRSPSGSLQFLSTVARNLSDRKQAEAGLLREKAFTDTLINSLPGIFYLFDREGRFLRWNRSLETVSGYSSGEVASLHPLDLIAEDDRPLVGQRIGQVFERGEAGVEAFFLTKDRHRIPYTFVGVRIEVEGRPCLVGTGLDITNLRQAQEALNKSEEQLAQSRRLEAVGQLAGGIAHDFNNLLGVITGYCDLLLRDIGSLDPRSVRVEQIRRAAERAAGLTRQLLAFSRKQILQPTVLDLNQVVADVEKMLRRLIGENIDLKTELSPGLRAVKADPGQIEQVVVNLAVNARDAMPNGGQLTVETANLELDEAYAREHAGVSAGPHVRLTVSDTGHGMDADTLSHIFEPFFTTKEPGRGTGLGLATVYGIVQQSGGHVTVRSEPGHGSSFRVCLPVADEVSRAVSVAAAETTPRGNGQTVLLVEDEMVLRVLVCEILEDGGYQVLDGGTPTRALEVAETHSGPIHLVVSDVIMPEMSGPELSQRLLATRPQVRILYMSGYTDEAIGHHGVLDPGTHFIQKPFTSDALLRKVSDALAGGQSSLG